MPSDTDLLMLLQDVRGRLAGDVLLDALAARAGWSPFHLHRAFQRLVSETPKRYTQRLRLGRAAARLVSSRDRVLDIALESGLASHEVFTRAFRRQFSCSPERYRAIVCAQASPAARARHAEVTVGAGPCLSLYHLSLREGSRRHSMSAPTVVRKDLSPQPALIVRKRIPRSAIAATITEALTKIFAHSQKTGLTIAGWPFSRYPSVGPGLMTIECGVPLAAEGSGEGEVEAVVLPGGPAAFALYMEPYDKLTDTYAAIEQWMESSGACASGAPWEQYVNDPSDFPDPADWKTEVYWPLER